MSKAKILPSEEILNELLRYDPETGLLFWKKRKAKCFRGEYKHQNCSAWNKKYTGKKALNIKTPCGYRRGPIFDEIYYSHRIIFKMVHGYDPKQIDHINGNRQDNRIINLRSVDRKTNARNIKKPKDNSSGFIGVYYEKKRNNWRAQIGCNGKQIRIGRFANKKDAIEARKNAEIKYGFHENHGR